VVVVVDNLVEAVVLVEWLFQILLVYLRERILLQLVLVELLYLQLLQMEMMELILLFHQLLRQLVVVAEELVKVPRM
jgi:hypothetical protein